MISCEEARIICHKTQYRDASFMEVLKLKLHLLICRACSTFSKKNTKLTTLCEEATLHALTEQEKVDMKQKILENI